MKIVIEVSGGCVTAVRCDDPKAEVVLIDWDNGDEEGEKENENQDRQHSNLPVIF